MTSNLRTYSDLLRFKTFEERYDYLKLAGVVGASTFGYDRWENQNFYTSREWKDLRFEIIARDEGLDLGVTGHEIYDRVIIHHMNPMTPQDLAHGNLDILDPEYLITVSHNTHNAIHYGDKSLLPQPHVERRPGDTQLWSSIG